MARLIVKSMERTPLVFELKPGVNRFGRRGDNDHSLDDPAISEQHCEITVENDFVFVRDLGSTNGTFIDRQPIGESALYSGQTLHIGPVEMVLEGPAPRVAIPELPPLPDPRAVTGAKLADGHPSCLKHAARHAVWECTHCAKLYCDECVRKLGRVGGRPIKLCPACSNRCKLSAWAETVKRRKKSMLATLADKVRTSFKRTTQLFAVRGRAAKAAGNQPRPGAE